MAQMTSLSCISVFGVDIPDQDILYGCPALSYVLQLESIPPPVPGHMTCHKLQVMIGWRRSWWDTRAGACALFSSRAEQTLCLYHLWLTISPRQKREFILNLYHCLFLTHSVLFYIHQSMGYRLHIWAVRLWYETYRYSRQRCLYTTVWNCLYPSVLLLIYHVIQLCWYIACICLTPYAGNTV